MFVSDSDVPLINEFDPRAIPMQARVIRDIRERYDYEEGVHQLLLSGAVGSAKSLLGAHLAVTHCDQNVKAHCGIGRLTMPDLKETMVDMVLDHIGESGDIMNYSYNKTTSEFKFNNGSKISSHSWHDQKYKKFRSKKFSAFIIEELTENETSEPYDAILMRMGRLSHVKEKFLASLTNPDSPEHWAYKKLIIGARTDPNIHIYYSLTEENPFLDPAYIEMLKRNLDPQMAKRMLYGQWVTVGEEVVYYSYGPGNYRQNESYVVDLDYPIRICFDFNIGHGKPMSCALMQKKSSIYHVFDEVIIEGARTGDIMDELASRGLLDYNTKYIIHGDQTGKRRDTRQHLSDYDIIEEFLESHRVGDGYINFELDIPTKNPPVRTRHNLLNAQMNNLFGQIRFFVYQDAPVTHEGFTLTKLKKGGQYIEDDSKSYQHVTTAIGYGVCSSLDEASYKPQGTVHL